ncbi:FAD-dependent oxidoreductase [Luteimonas sp. JM171]|uniref:FAD-dependent oxidoreductase n=1 Tax=Luteimonas sp. JM171 TaxID=1896164 RepID=UPI000855972F|nr:NAD(P)/FAD-dependent oxidoreductase [Luteimonas sp. JM171]AOH37126.1 kynurenine 3-monooxygenase [Luteimonas sp. JM171]
MSDKDKQITIVGAGLAGALLGALLARQGWQVDIYERRNDPRVQGYEGGRSINMALAERGRHALQLAGCEEAVMARTVMMRGRMVHFSDGSQQLQRYGRDDSEVIWSVHRGNMNIALLDHAEACGARLHFNRRLERLDFEAGSARFIDDPHGEKVHEAAFDVVIGADGAGSAVRAQMARETKMGERFEPLGHSYKELEIPPGNDGQFLIEPNALHIWPRDDYMCIALPNDSGNFTVTLFMPNEGDPGFDTVRTALDARKLFERDFPDALALMPGFDEAWASNPVSPLGTLYLDRWRLYGRAVLVGDAAHAMVPFHGQGMNCALEDCVSLARHIEEAPDLAAAFTAYENERRPNAEAIQEMALDNYREMRDRVDDADYLLQRELELKLQQRHPDRFVPRYAMVTFMRIPYAVALERARVQGELLEEATRGLENLDGIDWDALDARIKDRLQPLSTQEKSGSRSR